MALSIGKHAPIPNQIANAVPDKNPSLLGDGMGFGIFYIFKKWYGSQT